QEQAVGRWRPLDVDHPAVVAAQRVDVAAVFAVHRHTRPAGDESDDGVARNRRAAARQLDPDIAHTLHHHAGIAGDPPAPAAVRCGRLGGLFAGALFAAHALDELLHDALCRYVAFADGGVQGGNVGIAKIVGDRGEAFAGQHPLERQVLLAHRPCDGVLAVLDRLLAARPGEPLLDLVTGAGALDEREPVAARAR